MRRTGGGIERSRKTESTAGRAPVAIFAYRRVDTLAKTLAALENCHGFNGSIVHVFSDAGESGRANTVDDVMQVREFLREWCERTGAFLHEASSNKGLRASIIDGVSSILEQQERVIVLEDDIVVSRTFLKFMNEALEAYAGRNDIVQISGNIVPHKRTLPPIGLLRMPACWGWATWRRAWRHYRDDAASLLVDIKSKDPYAFDMDDTYANLEALEKNATAQLNTWFVRWYASVFLQDGLTAYPGRTLTRNIGFDVVGTNCRPGPGTRRFSRQRIHDAPDIIDWDAIGTTETPAFLEAVKDFYRWQQFQWAKPTVRERLKARFALFARQSNG